MRKLPNNNPLELGGAEWLSRIEALPGAVRIPLMALGAIGGLLFLAFLSTKPFGRGFYNGPEWWGSWDWW